MFNFKCFEIHFKIGDEEQTKVCSSQEFIIGRSVKTEVQIDSNNVSRQHLKVLYRDGVVLIEDLNSTNGTYLNDEKLRPGTPRAYDVNDKLVFGAKADVIIHIKALEKTEDSLNRNYSEVGKRDEKISKYNEILDAQKDEPSAPASSEANLDYNPSNLEQPKFEPQYSLDDVKQEDVAAAEEDPTAALLKSIEEQKHNFDKSVEEPKADNKATEKFEPLSKKAETLDHHHRAEPKADIENREEVRPARSSSEHGYSSNSSSGSSDRRSDREQQKQKTENEAMLRNLKQEKHALITDIESLKTEKESLIKYIDSKDGELSDITRKINSSEEKFKKLEADSRNLINTNTQQIRESEEKGKIIQQLVGESNNLRSSIDKLNTEINEKTSVIKQIISDIGKATEDFQKNKNKYENEISLLQDKKAEQEKKVQLKEADVLNYEKRAEQLKSEVLALDIKVSDKQKEYDNVNEIFKDQVKKNQVLKEEWEQLNLDLKEDEEKLSKTENLIIENNEEIKHLDNRIISLKADRDRLEKRYDDFKQEVKKVEDNLEVLQNEINELKNEKETCRKENERIIKAADDEKDRILKQADLDRIEIIAKGNSEAQAITDNAKKEAELHLKEAAEKVNQILSEGKNEVNVVLEAAELEAKNITEKAEKASADKLKAAQEVQDVAMSKAKDEAEKYRKKFDSELATQREKADKEIQSSKSHAEEEAKSIVAKASKDAEKILKEAKDEAQETRVKAVKQMDDQKKAFELTEKNRFKAKSEKIKKELELILVTKLKPFLSKQEPETIANIESILKGAVSNILTDEVFDEGEVLATMLEAQTLNQQSKVKRFWKVATVSTVVTIVFSIFGLPLIIKEVKQQSRDVAATVKKQNEEQVENRKNEAKEMLFEFFSPQKTKEFKDNYTDRVLYTEGYVDKVLSADYREKWIIELQKYFTDQLDLSENNLVPFISMEANMIKDLDAEAKKINGRFIDQGIERMRAIEEKFRKRALLELTSEKDYEKVMQFQKKFYQKN